MDKNEEQRKAHNTIRLFGGMKRDLNMLCWVVANIATQLNIDAEKYMGKEEEIVSVEPSKEPSKEDIENTINELELLISQTTDEIDLDFYKSYLLKLKSDNI